jgi:hypothetical protein
VEVLEQGDIQFLFRPSVQAVDADELTFGIQSLFAILSPAGGRDCRRLRIGRKRMPAKRNDRFWARIERVGSLQRVLGTVLESDTYSTKTRGERFQPAARPIAHGTYELSRHDDHIHFTYRVEPFLFEDAPDEVAIDSASHVVLFENPAGRAKWTVKGEIAQLDDEGAELVLVGACAMETVVPEPEDAAVRR